MAISTPPYLAKASGTCFANKSAARSARVFLPGGSGPRHRGIAPPTSPPPGKRGYSYQEGLADDRSARESCPYRWRASQFDRLNLCFEVPSPVRDIHRGDRL